MKRVLIFSLAYFPHVGGAEIAVKEITDRIDDIEFEMVTLRFSKAEPREEKIGNVFVHRVGNGASRLGKLLFQCRAARAGARLHEEHRFDAAWAIMAHSAGVPAALFSSRTGVPFLLTLQEGDPFAHIERTMRPLWPWFSAAFTRAARVQAISNYLASWAVRRGYPGEVDVIPNGVDVRRFAGVSAAHETEKTVLVSTSRLVRKNALDDVIRALVHLPQNVRLRLYGIGPEEAPLKELADRLAVRDRVEFRGHIDHARLPEALAACDIFVRPSRSEGMGNSFIEAMAAGLPVVATQEGGIADFLFDAKRNPDRETTGWAVDVDAPEQIANAVKEILSDPQKTQKVREQAFRLVQTRYDWDLVAKEMRGVLAKVAV